LGGGYFLPRPVPAFVSDHYSGSLAVPVLIYISITRHWFTGELL